MILSNFGSISATVDPCSGNILASQRIFRMKKIYEIVNSHKNSPQGTPTSHRVPVRIQIVYCGDDASITIRIVHVQNVVRTVRWIACNHCLCRIMRKLGKICMGWCRRWRPYHSTNLRSFTYFVFAQ